MHNLQSRQPEKGVLHSFFGPTYRISIGLLLLALVGGVDFRCLPIAQAAPEAAGGAEAVAKLVTQLGSKRFKDREVATQTLEAVGAPALGEIIKATHDKDPEVRRRAEALAEQIRKRMETAEVLEPKLVHLAYEDKPVREAVADLAARTGFSIQLRGDTDRRVTLDTGEISFWEAFDQLCQKAGLAERTPTPARMTTSSQEIRMWNAQAGVQMRVIPVQVNGQQGMIGGLENGLALTADEKPQILPTHYAGAVRIRALPVSSKLWKPNSDETLVAIEITPQPKMAWQNTMEIRIDRAVDEHGQVLASPTNKSNDLPIAARANGVMFLDAETGRPLADGREGFIRLKLGEKPAHQLKEIKGTVVAQVQTAVQELAAIDNLPRTVGETAKGVEGRTLKVLDVTPVEAGEFKIRAQLEEPWAVAGGQGIRGQVAFRRGRMIVRGPAGAVVRNISVEQQNSLLTSWSVLDGKGKALESAGATQTTVPNVNAYTQEVELRVRPRPGQGEPSRLVYKGRRTLLIEVPFALKDVPIP